MKNTTKNKQRRRQKIKSRKNKMKRNAKRTLRRHMKGGINISEFDPIKKKEIENSSSNPHINNMQELIDSSKSNPDEKQSVLSVVPDIYSGHSTTPQQNGNLLQPQSQPQLTVNTTKRKGRLRNRVHGRRNSVKQSDPPIPYQSPPQAPPQEQKRLPLVKKRQLILTKILNKINYSFDLIKYYLNEINDELIKLDYRSDAKYIKKSLESDLSDMITNIYTQIIPNRTNYGIYIFNNFYIEKYNYAIRNIIHTIELINNKKTSYFVIFERTKDKNKKLEIVKMFENIKKEYAKIYNNVIKLVV